MAGQVRTQKTTRQEDKKTRRQQDKKTTRQEDNKTRRQQDKKTTVMTLILSVRSGTLVHTCTSVKEHMAGQVRTQMREMRKTEVKIIFYLL